jgi:hypothetical protein
MRSPYSSAVAASRCQPAAVARASSVDEWISAGCRRRGRSAPRAPARRAAPPELDVVDAVDGGVESGERESALVDVGRDDELRVPRGQESLDPAARGDVECPGDRSPDGEVAERRRRPVDPCDVLGADQPGEVGGQDESPVRHDAHRRPHTVVERLDQPKTLQALHTERCERLVGRHDVDLRQQQEQPRQHREGALVRCDPTQVDRVVARPRQDAALRSEQLLDRAGLERGCLEQGTEQSQRRRVVGGGGGTVVPRIAAIMTTRDRGGRRALSAQNALACFTSQPRLTAAPREPSGF